MLHEGSMWRWFISLFTNKRTAFNSFCSSSFNERKENGLKVADERNILRFGTGVQSKQATVRYKGLRRSCWAFPTICRIDRSMMKNIKMIQF